MGAMKGRFVSARGPCGTDGRSTASRIAGFRSSMKKFVSVVAQKYLDARAAASAPFVRFEPTFGAAVPSGASALSCVDRAVAPTCTSAGPEALADALRDKGRVDRVRRAGSDDRLDARHLLAPDQMMWAGQRASAIGATCHVPDRRAALGLTVSIRNWPVSMVLSGTAVRGVKKKASEGWRTLQGLRGAVEVGQVPRRLLAMARTKGAVPGVDVADRGVGMGFAPR